jgi:hypothetical protein
MRTQRRYFTIATANRIGSYKLQLDYLEEVTPIQFASAEALNTTYKKCNRRIQALRALGENVKAYDRILVLKILRAFPDDICRRIIQVKQEGHFEGDVVKLMEFLGEEVDGALMAQKIRVRHHLHLISHPRQLHFTSAPSQDLHLEGAEGHWSHSVYFVKVIVIGLKTVKP